MSMIPPQSRKKIASSVPIPGEAKKVLSHSPSEPAPRTPRRRIFLSILYGFYVLAFGIFIGYHLYFAQRVISGVTLEKERLGVSGISELPAYLTAHQKTPRSVVVKPTSTYQKTITPEDIGFRYLPIATAQKMTQIGRSGNFTRDLMTKVSAITTPIDVRWEYTYDAAKAKGMLAQIESESITHAHEPAFQIANKKVEVLAEIQGKRFNMDDTVLRTIASMDGQNTDTVEPGIEDATLQFTKADYEKMLPIVQKKYIDGIVFKYEESAWAVPDEQFVQLFKVVKKDDASLTIAVDPFTLSDILDDIEIELNRNPRGQVIAVEDGKIIQFVPAEDGRSLNVSESRKKAEALLLTDAKEIPLVVTVTKAPKNENEYQVEDIVGIGKSRFKGSIAGRIHNIELAASRIHGALIPPDAVFSFNDTVGEISKKTGFAPAYVISKGRTVLGDGGGVCQVSTTLFRAALDAGLPIVERHAHSYRVSYYEQESSPGIDATVYSPSADLKFKNDTGNYIVIASEFDKKNASLVFKFYGKKDGRIVELTKPVITSRSAPPPAAYVDDPTRPKGSRVQVEHAVGGAVTVFTRVVTKNGVQVANDSFKSVYRAWQAVYMVGTR